MKIKITQEIDVPCSPWCGNCFKVVYDEQRKPVCGLSGIYLDEVRGKLLKTIRCYDQLYFALVQEGRKKMDKYIKERDVFSKFAAYLTPADVIHARILLAQIPAADVVEVVRCKDCQWYDASDHLCDLYGNRHFDGFYCHDGERRSDNG